jgi:DNA-directed RNA polymerase subunit N (RpoN/RPB10)
MDLECLHPRGYMKNYCSSGHLNIIPIRCHSCENCEKHKIRVYRAQVATRFRNANFSKNFKVHLWTLGTDLLYTEDNYLKLKTWFTLWRKRIRKKIPEFPILIRVYEAGSNGNRLHVHFITSAFLDHKYARQVWSDVTGIKNPNVNYSSPKRRPGFRRDPPPISAFMYMLKYMTKNPLSRALYVGKLLWYKWKTISQIVKTSLIKNKFWSDKKKKFLSGYVSEAKQILTNGNYITRIIHAKDGYIADYKFRSVPLTCNHENCNSEIVLKFAQIHSYDYVYSKVNQMACSQKLKKDILKTYML